MDFIKRFLRLIFGLSICGCGIVLALKANIGVSAWECCHMGLSQTFGISFGTANILAGYAILGFAILLGAPFGLGTIVNIMYVGKFVDFLLYLDIIPLNASGSLPLGVAMILGNLVFISLGCFLYIGSGFGSGPRDSLMVGLARRFPRVPVGALRGAIEGCAVLTGWLLGGQVGVGTIISITCVGFVMQAIFKLLHFEVAKVKQENIIQTFKNLLGRGEPAVAATAGAMATAEVADTASADAAPPSVEE